MFRLVISDTIEFPVRLSVNDGGRKRDFTIRLQAQRVSTDEMQRLVADGLDQPLAEFLRQKITGWREQSLVVDGNDQPAPFSEEAFGVLLGLFGAAGAIFSAYLDAQSQHHGMAGRAKNSGP